MQKDKNMKLFNLIFSAMGMALLSIAGWIALSVAHIPSIETKLDDFMRLADGTLRDHEIRIRALEVHQ